MAKHPPVPPENRNPHDPDVHASDSSAGAVGAADRRQNPDKQGQQANTRQNTTHQGFQQDR